ncbi:MAG: cell division protein FtsL [Gallionella sp.]
MWHSNIFKGVLLLSVMTAALSVVSAQHQARKLFIQLRQEKKHAHQMEVEWGQLQLEQSTLAAPARVEKIATRQLNMQLPTNKQIKFLQIGTPLTQKNGTKPRS